MDLTVKIQEAIHAGTDRPRSSRMTQMPQPTEAPVWTPADPVLQVRNLHKSYQDQHVLRGVEFDIHQGQVKAVLGPSGSGKSTMLRLMALLEPANDGEILLRGRRLGVRERGTTTVPLPERELAKERRDIGMVFQKFNLFPHLSACRNVMLGLTSVQSVP